MIAVTVRLVVSPKGWTYTMKHSYKRYELGSICCHVDREFHRILQQSYDCVAKICCYSLRILCYLVIMLQSRKDWRPVDYVLERHVSFLNWVNYHLYLAICAIVRSYLQKMPFYIFLLMVLQRTPIIIIFSTAFFKWFKWVANLLPDMWLQELPKNKENHSLLSADDYVHTWRYRYDYGHVMIVLKNKLIRIGNKIKCKTMLSIELSHFVVNPFLFFKCFTTLIETKKERKRWNGMRLLAWNNGKVWGAYLFMCMLKSYIYILYCLLTLP